MRSRLTAILAAALVAATAVGAQASTAPNGTYHSAQVNADLPVVTVTVNGSKVTSDVPAVILDGRTLLPVRAVATAFGATVAWDQGTYTAALATAGAGSLSVPAAFDPPGAKYDGVQVPCSIAGKSTECILDTGLSVYATIGKADADAFGLHGTPVTVNGSSGASQFLATCTAVSLGNGTPVAKGTVYIDPNLALTSVGLGYLRAVSVSWTVDLARGALTLGGVVADPSPAC